MSQRKLAVCGTFYPSNKSELERYLNHFNRVLEENNIQIEPQKNARAIIVPHAGYVYSGFTANMAYKTIPEEIQNIIVIGPSHKFSFEGASISLYDKYPTPFGMLDINVELAQQLRSKFEFLGFYDEVHSEHSTETQFPFIKYYQDEKRVVEIIYSRCEYMEISQLIKELLKDKNNFLIISTDLSHFHSLDIAKKKDAHCLEAIASRDIKKFSKECEACGIVGVKGIVEASNELKLKMKLLDYRTSADVSGDKNSVVGYSSFLVYS